MSANIAELGFTVPSTIRDCQVGPRDGLQSEGTVLKVDDRVNIIDELAKAGYQYIEPGSLVRDDKVPAMANTAEVCQRINRRDGVRYPVVVNPEGFQRAIDLGITDVALVTGASPDFNQRNSGIRDYDDFFISMATLARSFVRQGGWLRGYVSTSFQDPITNAPIDPQVPLYIAKQYFNELDVSEVCIADTTNAATPRSVFELLQLILFDIEPDQIAMHFHDADGGGLANVLEAMRSGIATFDTSFGGLGGCRFAGDPLSNLASEDLLTFCRKMGIETGIDRDIIIDVSAKVQGLLGRELPSRVLQRELAKRARMQKNL